MIYVVARIELEPGSREAFLGYFRELVPKVLAERGCLAYLPTVEAPTALAKPAGRDVVVVLETWQSIADLEMHLAAPHMVEFRKATASLRRSVELTILEPA